MINKNQLRETLNNTYNKEILNNIKIMIDIENAKNRYNYASRLATSIDSLGDPNRLLDKLNEFKIVVTELETFGVFWAQINEPAHTTKLADIQVKLNAYRDYEVIQKDEVYLGKLVAAPFCDENFEHSFFRAKITQINSDKSVDVNISVL